MCPQPAKIPTLLGPALALEMSYLGKEEKEKADPPLSMILILFLLTIKNISKKYIRYCSPGILIVVSYWLLPSFIQLCHYLLNSSLLKVELVSFCEGVKSEELNLIAKSMSAGEQQSQCKLQFVHIYLSTVVVCVKGMEGGRERRNF